MAAQIRQTTYGDYEKIGKKRPSYIKDEGEGDEYPD